MTVAGDRGGLVSWFAEIPGTPDYLFFPMRGKKKGPVLFLNAPSGIEGFKE